MSNLDQLIKHHVEQAHAAVSTLRPPGLEVERARRKLVARRVAIALVVTVIVAAPLAIAFLQTPADDPADDVVGPDSGGSFSPTGSMTQGCAWCLAVLLDDGRVLVMPNLGGSAQLYDPASGEFSLEGTHRHIYYQQRSTVKLVDGRVLLLSGLENEAEIYDPMTGAFEEVEAPGWGTAVAAPLDDGRVLVVGGTVAEAKIFDPATGGFAVTGSPASSTGDGSAVLLKDGRVFIAAQGRAQHYDPATGRFTVIGPIKGGSDYQTVLLDDGRVLILRGVDGEALTLSARSMEIYDPTTGKFAPTGPMHTPRWWQTAAKLDDGRVLVVGGVGAGSGLNSSKQIPAEVFDPETGEFSVVRSEMTQPRVAATAVTLADGRVLILGHYQGNVLSPGFVYPSSWSAELFEP